MGSVGILGTKFTPAFIHFPSIQFLGGVKPRQANQSHATIRKNLFSCFDLNNEAEEDTVADTWDRYLRYLILNGAGFGKLLLSADCFFPIQFRFNSGPMLNKFTRVFF